MSYLESFQVVDEDIWDPQVVDKEQVNGMELIPLMAGVGVRFILKCSWITSTAADTHLI